MMPACSSTLYTMRSLALMRRDQQPLISWRRGSGLPSPVYGVCSISRKRRSILRSVFLSALRQSSRSSTACLERVSLKSMSVETEEFSDVVVRGGDGFSAFGLGESFADVGGEFGVGEDVGGFLLGTPVIVGYHDDGGFAPFDEDGLGVFDTGVHEFGEVLAGGAVRDGFCVHGGIVQHFCTNDKFFNPKHKKNEEIGIQRR